MEGDSVKGGVPSRGVRPLGGERFSEGGRCSSRAEEAEDPGQAARQVLWGQSQTT